MVRRRNLLVLVALLVGLLVVTACQPVAVPPTAGEVETQGEDVLAEEAPAEEQVGEEEVTEGEAAAEDATLVIYSGRNENLVGPLLEQFQADTGIDVEVRYGDTAEMAATILEEGENSPADVFYGQDAGALGALQRAGRFQPLPEDVLNRVDPRFRSEEGEWIGTSGRARVFVYNTQNVPEEELPDSIWELTEPDWQGRVGWAPTNGSFQAFVTALRVLEGEERAREWLEAMIANDVQVYQSNTPIVEAAGRGEIDLGLVNHYYLYRFLAEDPDFPAANYHPAEGGAGAMINVAGTGILDTAQNTGAAQTFVRYLLSEEAQQYFADETNEYPLIEGFAVDERLTPLSEINTPDIDLSDLADLEGTLQLLQEVGALN